MKKILISLAIIGLVGVTVVGLTGAWWSDTGTSHNTSFSTGSMELQLKGCNVNAENCDAWRDVVYQTWDYENMIPGGDPVGDSLFMRNNGNTPADWLKIDTTTAPGVPGMDKSMRITELSYNEKTLLTEGAGHEFYTDFEPYVQPTNCDIYVPANGNIQNAINSAGEGDLICLAEGTYKVYNQSWNGTSAVSITTNGITLAGAGSGKTILDAQHKTSSTYENGQHLTVIWNGADGVTFSGFTVKSGDHGIRSNGSNVDDVTFNDVVADDNLGAGFVFEGAGFETVTFKNSEAKNSGDFGIFFNGTSTTDNIVLSNTSANGNGHVGFSCQGTVTNLDIKGGTFNDNTGGLTILSFVDSNTYYGFGLELRGVTSGALKYVTMKGNGFDGPNIVKNLYGNEGGAGMVLKGTSNLTISNADIRENMNGIWIEDPDSMHNWGGSFGGSATIALSNIVDNEESGIWNFEDDITVDAQNNWWGDFYPANHAFGPVTYSNYLGGAYLGFINGVDNNSNGFADLFDLSKSAVIVEDPDLEGENEGELGLYVQLDGPTSKDTYQGQSVGLDVQITMGSGPSDQ